MTFPIEVANQIGYYVYRLIDPRNGETFYVGKGVGNRVFQHANETLDVPELSDKLKRIREIKSSGLEVLHVIHRHGLDEPTAYEVEGALIDAYSGLSNIAGGSGSSEFGCTHTEQVIRRYQAQIADFTDIKALIIKVNRTASDESLYEATRYAWLLNVVRAKRAEVVLAVNQGLIVGTFIAYDWLEANTKNFPDRENLPNRWAFIGECSTKPDHIQFVGKVLPPAFRRRGASNPISYTFE